MSAPQTAAARKAPRRRWLAPEVIQTSAMDCGPAALKCLLGGYGIEASYGRLREACQTDVDGTSIDTLEAIGFSLGLDLGQTMLPVDWLLLPAAAALPCLVVVRVAGGGTHFLVVWRRVGGWLQLMDPASGRRWVRCADFEKEVYRHEQELPAAMVRRWLGADTPLAVYAARLAALGLAPDAAGALLAAAQEDAGCDGLARLDAALRLAELLASRRALSPGEPARALLAALLAEPERIPARLFAIAAAPDPQPPGPQPPGAAPAVRLRGAVFLKVNGPRAEGADPDLPAELRAALDEPRPRPGRYLGRLLLEGGRAPLLTLAACALLAAAGSLALGLALRAFSDLRGELPVMGQRLAAVAVVAALAAGLLLVEAPAVAALLQSARQLELRLRLRFATKIPRLADRYFRSRPRSDMAQRAHALHRVRQLPGLASRFLRAGLGLVAGAAGLVWLDPHTALPAALGLIAAFALPLLALPALNEQDFKLRSHAGALTRFNLDALLGHSALRAHGAQHAVTRAYRQLLDEWTMAAARCEAASIRVEVALLAILYCVAAWLMLAHLGRGGLGSGSLLLAFWALLLPAHALDLARALWQAPALRSATLRLIEPLGALEAGRAAEPGETAGTAAAPATESPARGPAGFVFEAVTVKAGGHTLLDAIELELPAGGHLAVVGPSGAGKSSLLGLLLGWHGPSAGRLLLDGAPLGAERLPALRAATVWIDPEVQLWDASLLDNLVYGAGEGALGEVGRALSAAELETVVEKLRAGLGTRLGESGARFSGGEGQRVRIGRGLLRQDPRLVLLDEPFRGLTRESRERLLARLREVYGGTTLIFVSHDVQQALLFPRVLVIENGKVAEDGPPAELLAKPQGRLRALVRTEEALRERLRGDAGWRRLRLDRGLLAETVPAAGAEGPA